MKEKITEEYEKFENIMKGTDNQLCTLMLTDIMASMLKMSNDEDGNVIRDYSRFDDLVKNVKDLLDSVGHIPEDLDLMEAIQGDIDGIKRIKDECSYSMRTLSWIKDDLLNEEEEKNA